MSQPSPTRENNEKLVGVASGCELMASKMAHRILVLKRKVF
jgi:hypothetical protein